MLIKAKSAALKRRIVHRLRNEISTYFAIVAMVFLGSVFAHGRPARFLLLGAMPCFTILPIIAVLAFKEYRLRTLALSGTLRDSLKALVESIESTARLYVAAYVSSMLLSMVVIEVLLFWRWGFSFVSVLFLPAGLAFVTWSYFSGRRYAHRIFEEYRDELAASLRDLEGSNG